VGGKAADKQRQSEKGVDDNPFSDVVWLEHRHSRPIGKKGCFV
jgi:hypothetical protein